MGLLKWFFHEEEGATAVEYAIMVGLIAIVIVIAVTVVGGSLNELFESVNTEMGW